MTENIKNPKDRMPLYIYPDTWRLVNQEKYPRECMDDVIQRVFKEWKKLCDSEDAFTEDEILEAYKNGQLIPTDECLNKDVLTKEEIIQEYINGHIVPNPNDGIKKLGLLKLDNVKISVPHVKFQGFKKYERKGRVF